MKLLDFAHALAAEDYAIPLDMVVELVGQGVCIDDFVNRIDGFQVEVMFDNFLETEY